jgi:glycosyltransferase involved in cell wall biosynthesis
VVIKALACGYPVVATRVGGTPKLINAANGILVPPHDAESLRQALDTALSRTWDTARISAAYRRNWDVVADETYEVCRRALDSAVGVNDEHAAAS